MDKYQSYKPSGVEWIGEIPSHWKLTKTKYFSSFRNGYSFKSEDWIDEGIPVIRMSNIGDDGKIKLNSKNLNFVEHKNISSLSDFIIQKGDILISMTDMNPEMLWLGSTILFNEEGNWLLNQRVGNIRITKDFVDKKFYHYLSNSDIIRNQLKTSVYPNVQTNLSTEPIKNELIYLPPLQEQHQIVQFLDSKTELIDKLISTKERKITLLKEQRTSLINQVVTKGLNQDVKMKDSGVEWIGEIPEGWGVFKMKYGVNHLNEKGLTTKEDIKISPENVESMTGVCFNFYSEYEGEGMKFRKGDILLNKLRLYLKKIVFTEFDGYSMGEMIVLRCNENLFNRYFYFLIFHQGLIDLLDSQSNGVKLPRVSPEVIMNSMIPFPPISEQHQIVEYLDSKTNEIDDMLKLEQKKIDILKEYRQSLISEVVTGKIKVTN